MSDKNKIILVGVGLLAATVMVVALGALLSREESPEIMAENGDTPVAQIGATINKRDGQITHISAEGENISILSAEGEFSFSASGASITGIDESSLSAKDLIVGMNIEVTFRRGRASSIRVTSIPPLTIISPPRGSLPGLDFNIEGIVYGEGEEVCLTLSNRRTGSIYEDRLSALISADKRFSIPVSLSSAIDAAPGDMLGASLSICGRDESITTEWGYYSGLTSRIKVYFLKDSCGNFHTAERVISASRSLTRAAIDELLKGPNTKEIAEGIFTSANPTERVQDVKVESNIVYFDFRSTILNTARCNVATLKSQITKTLNQLPIGKFTLTVGGEKENPLN